MPSKYLYLPGRILVLIGSLSMWNQIRMTTTTLGSQHQQNNSIHT